ncbi:MAG: hypothetical protein RLZZ297_876, partial [Chloroflexota bacterium]
FRNASDLLRHEPSRIVSRNVFFYDLRVSTEIRSEAHLKQIPLPPRWVPPTAAPSDIWEVDVPEVAPFVVVKPTPVAIPGAAQVVVCTDCDGAGDAVCADCAGRGVVVRQVKTRNADGSVSVDPVERSCSVCQGAGMLACRRCQARGELLEEQMFLWSQRTDSASAEDDPTTPHPRVLQQHLQVVFHAAIDLDDPRWQQIAPIAGLIRTAQNAHAHDGVIRAAELTIRATPLTDITYQLGAKTRSIAVIGYTNVVSADWGFYNWRSIGLAGAITAVLALVAAAVVYWR